MVDNKHDLLGTSIWFEGPRTVSLRAESAPYPGPGEIRVRALRSLISQGTELLVYRGLVPAETALTLATARGSFDFPVKYAYQTVGEIIDVGTDVPLLPGDHVFVRHPHQSVFTMKYESRLVYPVPAGLAPDSAIFGNLCEVALGALLDVPVRVGDIVVVYGQGTVGRICAALAARTAEQVIVVEPSKVRREAGGNHARIRGVGPEEVEEAVEVASHGRGADLVFEASGAPSALQSALEVAGIEATIVAVSYYGTRPVTLNLAPQFHFKRHRIVSSQVAMVGSGLQPRWDRPRRAALAMSLLDELAVEDMISHRFPVESAQEAYDLLDSGAEDVMAVVIEYPQSGGLGSDG